MFYPDGETVFLPDWCGWLPGHQGILLPVAHTCFGHARLKARKAGRTGCELFKYSGSPGTVGMKCWPTFNTEMRQVNSMQAIDQRARGYGQDGGMENHRPDAKAKIQEQKRATSAAAMIWTEYSGSDLATLRAGRHRELVEP